MKGIATIMIAMVIALAGVTVGYAAWSGNLPIEGSVATSDINVDWVNTDLVKPWVITSDYVDADVWVEGKVMHLRANNLYPGAWVNWGGFGYNSGSMPVKFKQVNLNVVDDPKGIASYLNVVPLTTEFSWDSNGLLNLGGDIGLVLPVSLGYSDFKFTNLDEAINGVAVPGYPDLHALPKFVLNPATVPGSHLFTGVFGLGDVSNPDGRNCITIKVDPNAPNAIENGTFEFTFEIVMEQLNPS